MSKIPGSIARLRVGNKNFEIIVDCEKALEIKKGQSDKIEEALLVGNIFKDARTGEVAGNLEETFGTEDVFEIAKQIIKKGEIQLTEEYRKKILEKKKNQILEELTKNAIDPTTKLPIPRQRIELGIEKLGYKFKYEKSVKEQVEELMKELKKVMPITFSKINALIEAPPRHIGHVYSIVKNNAKILKEDYTSDGKLIMKIEVSPGVYKEIESKLKNVSHGEIKIKEVV